AARDPPASRAPRPHRAAARGPALRHAAWHRRGMGARPLRAEPAGGRAAAQPRGPGGARVARREGGGDAASAAGERATGGGRGPRPRGGAGGGGPPLTSPLRVAVTGPTGFLGTSLLPALAAAGHAVLPVSRRPAAGGVRWDPARGELDAQALD